MNTANIVLFGFMGTGKSVVGRLVAKSLKRPFMDMDTELEKKTGKTIAEIFEEQGEPAFRQLECNLADELAGRSNLVIATGGGVVLNHKNIETLGRTGFLVCLTACDDELIRRLLGSKHRPLLKNGDMEKKTRELIELRRPFYNNIPTQVDTTRLAPHDVAAIVVRLFKNTQP